MRVWLGAWLACGTALAACGDAACRDRDGDGFGEGCAQGPDCDDRHPGLHGDCAIDAELCSAEPFAAGCPCLSGASRDCYSGPPDSSNVGLCRAGNQLCIRGRWTDCQDEVTPQPETCDGRDENCDGIVDDGVLSPCGGCDRGCRGGVWGRGEATFAASETLALTEAGELTLAREAVESTTVWVPNTADATVSRIDAASATETARYASGGTEPTRVAVDYNGDAWVANRSFGAQATVRKLVADPSRCVDRDGDGRIETSTGPDDVVAADECVRLTADVGEPGGVARALAVDGTRDADGLGGGNVWVGLHEHEKIVELDGVSGETLRQVDLPGLAPYAAAFDPWGELWVLGREGLLARVRPNPNDEPRVRFVEVPLSCFLLYGLAIDEQGTLTLSGFHCDTVLRYHPGEDRWEHIESVPSTRGIALLDGEAWVAQTAGRLARVGLAPLALADSYALASGGLTPLESIGVAVDSLGGVWVASTSGGPDGRGLATRFEPRERAVSDQVVVGRGPHAQGDLSGSQRQAPFVAQGSAQHVFEGCRSGSLPTVWERLHVAALPGVGATVRVEYRHAPERSGLAGTPFTVTGELPRDNSPLPLDVPDGGVVEVRLTLRSPSRIGAPRVERVGLEWRCSDSPD